MNPGAETTKTLTPKTLEQIVNGMQPGYDRYMIRLHVSAWETDLAEIRHLEGELAEAYSAIRHRAEMDIGGY